MKTRIRALVRNARQRLGEELFALARWVYDYWPHDPDTEDDRAWWEMSATFQGTEAEADRAFDRLTDMACGKDHHPLALCNLRVGGMRRLSDAEVNGDEDLAA